MARLSPPPVAAYEDVAIKKRFGGFIARVIGSCLPEVEGKVPDDLVGALPVESALRPEDARGSFHDKKPRIFDHTAR
jgi:hypothetical protein